MSGRRAIDLTIITVTNKAQLSLAWQPAADRIVYVALFPVLECLVSKYLILLFTLFFLWYMGDHRGRVELGPGVMAAEAPFQQDLSDG